MPSGVVIVGIFGIFCRTGKYITCMKATLKNTAVFLVILSMVMVVLVAVDTASEMTANTVQASIRVTVVDLEGNVVHNAKIKVQGQTFYTDNNGLSPSVQLSSLTNSYDGNITNWYTVNVVVEKEGFVPAVLFNCVVYSGSTRKLTVRLYASDSSDLPFVSYVESPPDDFVQQLIKQK